jgi:hypothetical protein
MKDLFLPKLLILCCILILGCGSNQKIDQPEKEEPAVEKPATSPDTSGDDVAKPPLNGKLEIKITFDKTPSFATSTFPKLKYNKSMAILMEFDDAAVSVVTAYNKLSTVFYTDGCGNKKNYNVGLAVNGRNQYHNKEIGLDGGLAATYEQRRPLILKGMDIMNHSYYHESTGNYNYGTDRAKNVKNLDQMILQMENYKMNTLIVPTNAEGFHVAASEFGYIGGSSQGTFDNFLQMGKFAPGSKINEIPSFNYLVIRRGFSDDWSNNGSQWKLSKALLVDKSFDFFEIGTHGILGAAGVRNFNDWIDDIVSKAEDRLIFCSLREFLEYAYLKDHVTKKEKITGNTLVVTLDYSTVLNKNISWYDLSLLANSDGLIASVTVSDPDFVLSYNKATNLINVTKRKVKW